MRKKVFEESNLRVLSEKPAYLKIFSFIGALSYDLYHRIKNGKEFREYGLTFVLWSSGWRKNNGDD